jgi:HlyD family secretion protein
MKIPKKWIWLGIVIIIAVLAFNLLILKKPFLYAGTLEVTKVDISARLSAAIQAVNVYEGDTVKKDNILITLVCEDYKIAAKLANENYKRNITLLKPGWTTPEAIDLLRTQMDDANTKVEWCTLSSPINGKVLSRYHEPGEWMSPGTKILTLANIQDIWVYIYVPQPKVAKLSYGMKLKAILPELNNKAFEGTIIKINDEAEFTPKNVQTQSERERLIYGIKVSFLGSNANEILKPGMTVEIQLPDE